MPVKLDAAAELMVYRLRQLAVTNIGKYATARHDWIELSASDGMLRASVRNDGIGFDTTAPRRAAYGLVGMRFRVEAAGAAPSPRRAWARACR